MILFLDDSEDRTSIFTGVRPDAKTAATALEMIELLKDTDDDTIVFLDHDLGGEVFVDSNREDCGMEVVRWIVGNKPKIAQIIVHSLNIEAAKEMVGKLSDAGYSAVHIPFIRLPWNQIRALQR